MAEQATIPNKYSDFADVFWKELATELLKRFNINKYAIDVELNKQPHHEPIYILGLIELKILKTYIKINLANGFIQSSKSSVRTLILFFQKPDSSLFLYVNYCGLNNLKIKNQYLLLLIGKLLNWLSQAKQFTHCDLTKVYHCMRIKKGNE